MTSRANRECLAVIGFVDGITEMIEDQETADNRMEIVNLALKVRSKCDAVYDALDKIDLKELAYLQARVDQFKGRVFSEKSSIVTFTSYSIALVEDVLGYVKGNKQKAFESVLEALLELHDYVDDTEEAPLDNYMKAKHAFDVWEELKNWNPRICLSWLQ